MSLFKQFLLEDSIEIKTTPENIWEFFTNLEQNYKSWHPEDHVLFKWTKGKPMETGSAWYGEEFLGGNLKKFKGTIGEVVPNRKIVFQYGLKLTTRMSAVSCLSMNVPVWPPVFAQKIIRDTATHNPWIRPDIVGIATH